MATSQVPLTAIELAAIKTKLTELENSLALEVGLSSTDRMKLFPIGRKSTQFVQWVVEVMQVNSAIAPQFVDATTLNNGYEFFNQMGAVLIGVDQVRRKIEDNMLLTGSNTHKIALDIYNSSKRAAKSGVPGAQAIVDLLKPHFYKKRSVVAKPANVDATGDSAI